MHPFSFPPLILLSLLLFSLFALIASFPSHVSAAPFSSDCLQTFDCGPLKNLSYPFTLRDDCGLPEFRLTCENDSPELAVGSISYLILRLNQTEKTMTLARSDLWNNTCPHEFFNSTLNRDVFDYGKVNEDLIIYYGCSSNLTQRPSNLFNCSIDGNPSSNAYFLVGPIPNDPILSVISCTVGIRVKILQTAAAELTNNRSMLREVLMEGFNVKYSTCANCLVSGGRCGFDSDSAQPICLCDNQPCPAQDHQPSRKLNWRLIVVIGIPTGTVVGIVVLSLVIICNVKRGHLSSKSTAWWKRYANNYHFNAHEEIIANFGSMAPKRYTYSDLKKLTKSFKDKVGEGGFGVVYKGKLPDGRIVAVKVLSKSEDNGEEFINEVASISRTSHVNIVSLLGFCCERSRRALIYEFVTNGSLDGFIYDKGTLDIANCHLENKTMFQIAIGIARGLEYLHSGCRTRILHLDIKPHNILLDKNFCPKISDFGLAKICKTRDQSVVSMMGTRGTIGYIAPEVFSRTFGGVSHKSDVYSYGMLVLEMVGGRKDIEGGISGTSEKYFPHGIYKKLEQDEILGNSDVTGDEEDIVKKMIIVSLWCIQTNPSDRPSIGKVIEMLEGSTLHSLQFPPKPFLNSPPRPPIDSSTTSLSM